MKITLLNSPIKMVLNLKKKIELLKTWIFKIFLIVEKFENKSIKIKHLVFFFDFKTVAKVENLDLNTLKPKISAFKRPNLKNLTHGEIRPLNSKFGYNDLLGCRSIQGDTVTSVLKPIELNMRLKLFILIKYFIRYF